MMALDRGAIEANYTVGKYSDVLAYPRPAHPYFRPGTSQPQHPGKSQGRHLCRQSRRRRALRHRQQPAGRWSLPGACLISGSTSSMAACTRWWIMNRSLAVAQPCLSLPWPVPAPRERTLRQPGQPVGGPSSTPADTAFPHSGKRRSGSASRSTAKPAVPAGQTHAQVTVPLTYNGENPCTGSRAAPPASAAPATATPSTSQPRSRRRPRLRPRLPRHRNRRWPPRLLRPDHSSGTAASSTASATSSPKSFGK